MMTEDVLLTKEGLEKIKAEHEELVLSRKEMAARIKEAREFGDISENAEYDAAKNEQAELEERITKLENMIRNAKIIEDGQNTRGKVNVGNKVKVMDLDTNEEKVFSIVGATEADPFNGRVSNESPVGSALIGHKTGEEVEIEVPKGKITYKILRVSKK